MSTTSAWVDCRRQVARILIVLALVSVITSLVPVGVADAVPERERVIVVLRGGDHAAVASSYRRTGMHVSRVYRALPAYAAALTSQERARLVRDPRVLRVEHDVEIEASGVQTGAPWNLDRIDQTALPLDGTYRSEGDGGAVTAYVFDSGIRSDHEQLSGRVLPGFDATGEGSTDDCNGHGTHVAGSIGATTHGVAKAIRLVPVRVLGCDGSGRLSSFLAGVDWVIGHHDAAVPAVANLSIGAAASSTLDAAVTQLVADRITVVAAAGNDGTDACTSSPARAPAALTVAATSSSDSRPTWSNYGSCLDLFAPGVAVTSLGTGSSTALRTASGTSMASPHVAGAAALYLATTPAASPADVHAAIVGGATAGVVGQAGSGSPNRLLATVRPTVVEPATVPASPTSVRAAGDRRKAKVTWRAPTDGGNAVVAYTVRAHRSGSVVETVTVSATSTSVTIPLPKGTFRFTVRATNSVGAGSWSAASVKVRVT